MQIALADLHWKADRLAEWQALSRGGVESLQEAVRIAPSDPLDKQIGAARLTLADRYAELGLWAESATEMRLALERVGYDTPYHGEDLYVNAGRMSLLAGDRDGYRKCATEGLRLRADTDDPVQAHRLLLLLSLSSDAPVDRNQRDRLAAVATGQSPNEDYACWGLLSEGASLYRTGKDEQALDRLKECLRGPAHPDRRAVADSFRALALHKLGRLDDARAALDWPAQQIDNETRAAAAAGRIGNPFPWTHYHNPYREASKVVLGRTDPHGPYLRLLRGGSYARMGEKALAEKEFAAAIVARPDDPDVLALRARIYTDLDWQDLAAADVARSKELLDRILAGPIDNPETAGRLADQLLAVPDGPGTILKPTQLKSEGGAALTVQPDGSVLASGRNPDKDVYTFETEVGPGSFACLCLDTLPHFSLPGKGPGRYPHHGNFCLTEITLQAAPADGKAPATSVPFVRASSSYASDISAGMGGARAAIDGKSETFWDVWPRVGQAHTAWFELAKPVGGVGRTRLTIRLEFQSRHEASALGRFRLSLLTAPPLRLAAAGRLGDASLDSFGGYARLAAVLAATGHRATVAARMFDKALESEETAEKLQAVRQAAVHDDAVFLELSKIRPRDAELWTARGRHLPGGGKKQEADEAFAQAAKLKPNESP